MACPSPYPDRDATFFEASTSTPKRSYSDFSDSRYVPTILHWSHLKWTIGGLSRSTRSGPPHFGQRCSGSDSVISARRRSFRVTRRRSRGPLRRSTKGSCSSAATGHSFPQDAQSQLMITAPCVIVICGWIIPTALQNLHCEGTRRRRWSWGTRRFRRNLAALAQRCFRFGLSAFALRRRRSLLSLRRSSEVFRRALLSRSMRFARSMIVLRVSSGTY